MKKILIVGGCGYIGGYLTDILNNSYDVTVYDNLLYEPRFLKKVNFIFGDVRDEEKLKKILPEFDIVIWLAAVVGDGACAVNPEKTYEINTESVKTLVKNFKGKIIFMSTCSVYGVNHELIDEKSTPNPLSVYASTKLEAEQYLLKNVPDVLIYRLGTLFGLGDEHSRIRLDLVANILTKKAVEGEKLKVFGGEQWRPLLHVKDVSHAIEYGLRNQLSGLYNLSYDNYTIKQLAEEIISHIPEAQIEYVDMKFEDQRNYRVSTDKIKFTGWKPLFTLKDGILELVEMFREKRIKELNDPIYSNEAYLKQNKQVI